MGGIGYIELDGIFTWTDESGDVPEIRRGKANAGGAAVDAELGDLADAAGVEDDGGVGRIQRSESCPLINRLQVLFFDISAMLI